MSYFSVSVIVVTYNANKDKLMSTLKSIINQKCIDFEIILTDDGSNVDYFEDIVKFFESNNISDYRLIKKENNVGTVKNLYGALLNAFGEYTYMISPGDMLYDENTLSQLYKFSTVNNIDVCFGNAVYYKVDEKHPVIIKDKTNDPPRPWLFNPNNHKDEIEIAFFIGNYILGATFFRKTNVALNYIEKIKDISKYVEDNTTTAMMVADGVNIAYFDNYVVWYEYGTGVSTVNSKKWNTLIDRDFKNCFKYMANVYSDDVVLSKLLTFKGLSNKVSKVCYLLFFAPKVLFKMIRVKFSKRSVGYQKIFDVKKLEYYLGMR